MKFHISRWRFWWGYTVVFVLVMLAIWFTDKGADAASWIVALLAIALIVVLELMIRMEQVTITDVSIEYRAGLLSKNINRATYSSISNVAAHQTFFQRVFRFGDVHIDTPGSSKVEISLNNFSDASKIQKMISDNIHKAHETHAHHTKKPHVGP